MVTKHTAPWLPEGASEYASKLRKNPTMRTSVSNYYGGELIFDNKLSARILFNSDMKPVWHYVSYLNTHFMLQGPAWKHFLTDVQSAARGPSKRELRTFAEIKDDVAELEKHTAVIKRILRRHYDGEITVGRLYGPADIFDFEEPSDKLAMRHESVVPVTELLDKMPEWVWRNQSLLRLLKSPNHPDMPYQFFVRSMYSFFHYLDEGFNKWSLLARISNATELFGLCDSEKARGTCRDLAEEFAKPF